MQGSPLIKIEINIHCHKFTASIKAAQPVVPIIFKIFASIKL